MVAPLGRSFLSNSPPTIAAQLQAMMPRFTRAETQLAHCILENYPVSGLGSITILAKRADVSTPTVARMVQKLAFTGFPDFQHALRSELEAQISNPIVKRDNWAEKAPGEHILNRFTESVIDNISQSLAQIEPQKFDALCDMLAEPSKRVFVVGGRITRVLADYFFLHMQVIRPNVTLIQSISNAWPHYLLDVKKGDVVVIFDIRRYETSTLRLAEMAHDKDAEIILFSDQWGSPVSAFSKLAFNSRISVPSAWDSSVATLLLLEMVIAEVQERIWPNTKSRMEELEDMFNRTRFFRKFT
jgi:DNA-binding MurR/RpiR family transcriptional regulator